MMFGQPSIPGETPLDDISGLRLRDITTKGQLNAAEAENIRKAIVKYLTAPPTRSLAPFDVAWSLRLHREMFGEVWMWAGTPRTSETNIGSQPRTIIIDLHNLLADLDAWIAAKMSLQEQAVRLHHRAVSVHPFLNGNGRWSRMLANIWLMRHGAGPIEWPEATIGSVSIVRNDYLAAVKAADAGDYTRLLAMHEQCSRKN